MDLLSVTYYKQDAAASEADVRPDFWSSVTVYSLVCGIRRRKPSNLLFWGTPWPGATWSTLKEFFHLLKSIWNLWLRLIFSPYCTGSDRFVTEALKLECKECCYCCNNKKKKKMADATAPGEEQNKIAVVNWVFCQSFGVRLFKHTRTSLCWRFWR